MESPAMTSGSLKNEEYMANYNLLMSYHFDAQIFLPYGQYFFFPFRAWHPLYLLPSLSFDL